MKTASSKGRSWALATVAFLTTAIFPTGSAATLVLDVMNVDADGSSSLVAPDVVIPFASTCSTRFSRESNETRCATIAVQALQRAICEPAVERTIVVSPTDNIVISPTDNDADSVERTIVISPTDNRVAEPAVCGGPGWTVVWWGETLAAIVTGDQTSPALIIDKQSTLTAELGLGLVDLGVRPDAIDLEALSRIAGTLVGDEMAIDHAFDSLEDAVIGWENGTCWSGDVLTSQLCAVLK